LSRRLGNIIALTMALVLPACGQESDPDPGASRAPITTVPTTGPSKPKPAKPAKPAKNLSAPDPASTPDKTTPAPNAGVSLDDASAIQALSQSPDPTLRLVAISHLKSSLTDKATDAIIAALADSDGAVRYAASKALDSRTHAKTEERLVAALDHTQEPIRKAAVAEMAKADFRVVNTAPIIKLLRNPFESPTVRAKAAAACAKLYAWDAMPPLVQLLDDPSLIVRQEAIKAIHKLTGAVFEYEPNGTEENRAKQVATIDKNWPAAEPGFNGRRAAAKLALEQRLQKTGSKKP
jgi:HEAT repeat protein